MAFKIHCDGCEVVDAPHSGCWLVVHEVDTDGSWGTDQPVLHFCSFGCLSAWAMTQAVDALEDRPEGT